MFRFCSLVPNDFDPIPISVVDFVTVWTLLDLIHTSMLAIIIVSGLFLLEFACPEVLLRDCNAGNEGIERPRLRILSKQSDLLSRTILICCFVVFAICLTAHLPGVVVV